MTSETQSAPPAATETPTPASTEDVKPVTAETKPDDSAPPADTPDGSNPEEAPKPDKGDAFQKKINKLTARAKAAEARAERAEAEALARIAQATPAKTATADDPKPPKLEDFPSYDAYEAAKDQHLIELATKRAVDKLKAETEQRRQSETAQAEAARKREAGQKFREKIEAAADRYENLDDAVEAFHTGGVAVSVPMLEFVYEHAEDGPALVHHLYANQELAEKISKLSPLAAALELSRLETTISKPQPRTISNAPKPPVVPKGGAEPPTKDLEAMSMSEFVALRQKQMSAERARRFK